jgi:ABC-type uncharacterized transport system substrate-binding protein
MKSASAAPRESSTSLPNCDRWDDAFRSREYLAGPPVLWRRDGDPGEAWCNLFEQVNPFPADVFNPDTSPQSKFFMRSVEAAAASHGLQAIATPVRTTTEIEAALQNFSREPNGGLILPTDSFIRLRSKLIAELAERHRLPSISSYDVSPRTAA